jgi:drug/metabolite transporter (DMT)-like permease
VFYSDNQTTKQALLKMHLATFLWGFTGILGRAINVGEYYLVLYRMVLTALILFIMLKAGGTFQAVKGKAFLKLVGIGGIIAIHWLAFYGSIKYANASIALVCLSTSGIYTAILEPLVFGKKIAAREIFVSVLAIFGMYLIYTFETKYTVGIIYGLISALLASVFSVLNKTVVAEHEPQHMAMYEIGTGSLVLLLVGPLYVHFFPQHNAIPSALDWLFLFLLSFFCTVIGQSLALSALKKLSTFTAVLTVNLEPVYGIALAFIVYKENKGLTPYFYWGIAVIALSVLAHMYFVWRQSKLVKS